MKNKSESLEIIESNSKGRVPKLRFPEFWDDPVWGQKRLGDIFLERVQKNKPDKQVLAATQDRGERSIIRENKNLVGYKLVLPGDFIISLRSFEGGFEYSINEGIISPAYTVMYSSHDLEKRFFRLYFKRKEFVNLIQRTLNSGLRDGKSINYKQASDISTRY
jgi:type I restriction enzyme S subunit